jgi:peptidoglycan/LPS O-acetylase OafA/YrhL
LKYHKSLDTLRALAVFFVLAWHFLPRANGGVSGTLELLLIPSGNFAVILFFVLSGYLITAILLNDKDKSGDKLRITRNFVIRRSLRIFPVYFLLLYGLYFGGYPFQDNEIFYQSTFTSNFFAFHQGWTMYSHTWSLAVEEQFYLLWPWLIIFIANRHHQFVFVFFIIFSIASAWYFGFPGDLQFSSPRTAVTTTNLAAFAIGGMYASLLRTENGITLIRKWIGALALTSLLLIYYWKFCSRLGLPVIFPYFRILAVSLVSIWIIHMLLNLQQSGLRNIVENKWLTGIGRISYGIYLYHMPFVLFSYFLMGVAGPYGIPPDPYLWFPFYCLAVTGVSYLSYRWIEKPILNYKKRFNI